MKFIGGNGIVTQQHGGSPGKALVSVAVDGAQMAEMEAIVGGMSDKLRAGASAAVNRTLTYGRRQIIATLDNTLAANKRSIVRRVYVLRYRKGFDYGQLRIYARGVSLGSFPARQTMTGVEAQILNGGQWVSYRSAFIRKINGNVVVMMRKGKARKPTMGLKSPPLRDYLDAGILSNLQNELTAKLGDEMNKQMETILAKGSR
jgi:hypothetical protein